jgi:hypothetical protein
MLMNSLFADFHGRVKLVETTIQLLSVFPVPEQGVETNFFLCPLHTALEPFQTSSPENQSQSVSDQPFARVLLYDPVAQ